MNLENIQYYLTLSLSADEDTSWEFAQAFCQQLRLCLKLTAQLSYLIQW